MIRTKSIISLVLSLSFLFSSVLAPAAGEVTSKSGDSRYYHKHEIRPGVRGSDDRFQGYIDSLLPLPVTQDENTIVFINSKSVIGDDSDSEINAGLGVRWLINDSKTLLGWNVFYDFRNTEYDNDFSQIGVGGEAFFNIGGPFEQLDLRVNGYFSLDDEEPIGDGTLTETYHFGSTTVLRDAFGTFEEPMSGIDYEAGVVIPGISQYVETRIYVGGYHYFSDFGDNINGIRGRLEVRPSPLVTVQLELTDDNVNDTDFFVGGYISLPFEIGNIFQRKNPFEGWEKRLRWGQPTRTLKERMTEPVIRDLDIRSQIVQDQVVSDEVVIDGIIFVDNTNGAAGNGNGTLENPYADLHDAFTDPRYTDGATIFVFGGDLAATNQTDTFTLADNTTLWGQGYERGFTGLFDPYGGIRFPKLDGGGGGDVVTMGTDTELTGFLVDPGDNGVVARNESNVSINHNIITGHNINGIAIINDDGGPHSGFSIYGNTITTNGYVGIYVQNTGGSFLSNFSISGNTIDDNGYYGDYYGGTHGGIVVQNSGSTISDFSISGNTIGTPDYGNYGEPILFDNDDSATAMNVNISGNAITNTDQDGIEIAFNNDSTGLNFNVFNNNITNTGNDGIFVAVSDGSNATNFTFNGNTINDISDDGFDIDVNNVSTASNWAFSNNTVTDNGSNGFSAVVDDSSMTNFTFTGNNMSSNGNNGFFVSTSDSDSAASLDNWTFTGNTFNSNGSDGVFVYIDNNSEANNWVFTGNTANSNGGDGFDLNFRYTYNSANNWTFTGNTANSNSSSGFDVYARYSSIQNWTFTGNTANSNGTYGFNTYAWNASSLDNWTFTGNTANTNGANGMRADLLYSGVITNTTANNWTFSGNTANGNGTNGTYSGIYIHVNDAEVDNWSFTNNTVNNNTGHGIEINLSEDNFTPANNWTFTNNQVTGNADDGFFISVRNVDNANGWIFSGNTISGNSDTGVYLDSRYSSTTDNWIFTGNTINSNGGGGGIFTYIYSSSSADNWTITGNTINNNSGDGIYSHINNNSSADNWTISDNSSTISGNTGDGLRFEIDNDSSADNYIFDNNRITSSGGSGIFVSVTDSASADDWSFTNNTITGSGNDGVNLLNDGAASFTNFNFSNNSIFNNTGFDIRNDSGNAVDAEGNFWGGNPGVAGDFGGGSAVDGVPFLATDPN